MLLTKIKQKKKKTVFFSPVFPCEHNRKTQRQDDTCKQTVGTTPLFSLTHKAPHSRPPSHTTPTPS